MPFDRQLSRAARIMRRAIALRCPRCGETKLFDGWFRMRRDCPACGLRFERAPGYWIGAIYINYGVTSGIAIGGYFVLWARAGLSTPTQFAIWIPFLLLFPLWFFRWSRSLWLAIEYLVNPEH